MRKIQKLYGKQEFGNLFEAKTVTKFLFLIHKAKFLQFTNADSKSICKPACWLQNKETRIYFLKKVGQ